MSLFSEAFRGRRVLITGHTGFKGSWLTSWMVGLGAQVCGYSDGIPTTPSLFESARLANGIRHVIGDVRDADKLNGVIQEFKPEYVFHLAAQAIVSTSYVEPLRTMGVNVMGTATLLDCLRKVDWPLAAVVITSDKAYENVEWPWGYRESDRLGGKDIYSGSKGAAELVFYSYFHSFFRNAGSTVRMATARAGNVIGGGDWAADRIVADCVRAWQNQEVVQIRSPKATRPWQHVLEPLSGYMVLGARLMESSDLNGESFNFGPRAEQNATVIELISSLAKIWGFADRENSYRVTGDSPFHEASLLKLNIDKALLRLVWVPNLSYEECMQYTGEWYRDVVLGGVQASEATRSHIMRYEAAARERGRVWAQ
jgi:CDP-glucose 4,6-dehydratase